MKEDLLKEFRNEYTMKLKMKQKNDKDLKTLMERKDILENSPLIKSYIELTEAINQLKNNTCSDPKKAFPQSGCSAPFCSAVRRSGHEVFLLFCQDRR